MSWFNIIWWYNGIAFMVFFMLAISSQAKSVSVVLQRFFWSLSWPIALTLIGLTLLASIVGDFCVFIVKISNTVIDKMEDNIKKLANFLCGH